MKTLLSTLLLTSAFGMTAHAASPMLDKVDLNKDGVVSKSEFVSAANARFAAADSNRDGKISKDERKAHREVKMRERANNRFEKADTNGDGVISKAEHSSQIDERMAKRKERMEARQAAKAEKGDKTMRRKNKRKRKAHMNPDLNKDGFIDRAEHEATVNARFERMDKNNNGILEAEELKRPKRGQRRGAKR